EKERSRDVKKSKYTEQQIAFALKQAELGTRLKRSAGRWVSAMPPSTTGGRSTVGWVPPSSGVKQLEEENVKLKRLVADLSLDKSMLQDVLSKKL
ncbi:putative transposase, partial [Nitrosospira briensis]